MELVNPIEFLPRNNINSRLQRADYSNGINPTYFVDEIWKDIPGFSRYKVSSYGRIYSKYIGRIMSTSINCNGYIQVTITNDDGESKSTVLHRLVALAFIPNPDNLPHVNHINAVRTDNIESNLEWCDRSYNNQYAYDIGNNVRGEDHPFAKHPEETVRKICQALQDGYQYPDIVEKVLGITDERERHLMLKVICSIRNRKKWKGVSKDYVFPEYTSSNNNFTKDDAHALCKLYENGYTAMEAVDKLYPDVKGKDRNKLLQAARRVRRRDGYHEVTQLYDF